MKRIFKSILPALFLLLTVYSGYAQKTIVDKYGKLSVVGNYMVGEHGDTVQLRGMSFFWSQWMGQYYNFDCVKWLRDDWKCTVVRAAMGVDMGGYLENPSEQKQKVIDVVDAAIKLGIYVIIDYHAHEAYKNTPAAKAFFTEMALKYGKFPNVIYEVFNEPLQDVSWSQTIKPYSESVLKAIRANDPDNIVIMGTRQWSQMVSEAAIDPIKDKNIMYTLHYYAATHGQWLRDEAQKAMDKGIALFVTEYGTCEASGAGKLDYKESELWWNFLDKHKISYCNWSVADKDETASSLKPGADGHGKWKENFISLSGQLVREDMIIKNGPIFGSLVK